MNHLPIGLIISQTTIKRDFLLRKGTNNILNYDLIAFAKHITHTKESGHYIAFTECNNDWVCYDKDTKEKIDKLHDDGLHKGMLFLYKQAQLRLKTCKYCSKTKIKCTARTHPYDK